MSILLLKPKGEGNRDVTLMKERERVREMRGVGGPLLCIGDLLSDVADDGGVGGERRQNSPPSPPTAVSVDSLSPYDLQQLFQVTLAVGGSASSNTGLGIFST